ncbi:MAG TPA: hypothetical protein VF021_01240 [Longimicrobiales bacterium]
MKSTRFLRCMTLAVMAALSACSGEPAGVRQQVSTLRYDNEDDSAHEEAHDWRDRERDSDDAPDLRAIARFTSRPAPPDPLHDHAMIGPEGGSLRVADFEIVVPAGAVARPTLFRIRVPVDPRAAQHAYAEFLPHARFNLPVTIRLPRATTDAPQLSPVLWWNGDEWVALPTTQTLDGRIEAQTSHFSIFGTAATQKGITILGG